MDSGGTIGATPRPAHERTFSPSDGPERDLEEVSMNAFLVELENKPGELRPHHRGARRQGRRHHRRERFDLRVGGSVALMTDNDATTRAALGGRWSQVP